MLMDTFYKYPHYRSSLQFSHAYDCCSLPESDNPFVAKSPWMFMFPCNWVPVSVCVCMCLSINPYCPKVCLPREVEQRTWWGSSRDAGCPHTGSKCLWLTNPVGKTKTHTHVYSPSHRYKGRWEKNKWKTRGNRKLWGGTMDKVMKLSFITLHKIHVQAQIHTHIATMTTADVYMLCNQSDNGCVYIDPEIVQTKIANQKYAKLKHTN